LSPHENEADRKRVDLYEDLVVDPADMPPNAAAYVRSRPWLTADVARQWEVGYLPRDARSVFRGWIVYTQRDERGEVISYFGRDVNYEDKYQKWFASGRPDGKKPNQHRYVSGYRSPLVGRRNGRLTHRI